jgi:hypothetical protein
MTRDECLHRFGAHDFGPPTMRVPVHVPVSAAQPGEPAPGPCRYWEFSYCRRCHHEHRQAVGFTPPPASADLEHPQP